MNSYRTWLGVALLLLLSRSAHAQVPFFYPGAIAFTPEIGIVETGVVQDVQATVTADRKYVTLTMRPQNATLLALQSYTFQNGGNGANGAVLGNVGDPPRAANTPAGNRSAPGDGPASAVRTSPTEILAYAKAQKSVLHHAGMTRISRLNE